MLRATTCIALVVAAAGVEAAPCASHEPGKTTVDRLSAGGDALLFCTGEQCWWLDTKKLAFTGIGALGPIPERIETRATHDGAVEGTPKSVTFCVKQECSTFPLGIKAGLVEPPAIQVNRDGTLAALRWVGPPEEGLPVWVVLFDLKAKKLVDKKQRSPGWVTVFADTFLVDKQLVSAAAKPVAKLPSEFLAAISPDGATGAFASYATKRVWLVDLKTGKVRHAIALPTKIKEEPELLAVFSPDGSRLYVVAGFPIVGETWIVNTSTGKVVGTAKPPAC